MKCDHGYPAGTACPYCAALAASRATTASLHREMVEALQAVACGPDCPWCKVIGVAPALTAKCRARAALEGWEKRPRLRQDDGVLLILAKLVVAPGFTVEDAADALEPLLFGERG